MKPSPLDNPLTKLARKQMLTDYRIENPPRLDEISDRQPYSPECVTESCAGRKPRKGASLCAPCQVAHDRTIEACRAREVTGWTGMTR